ncbi:S1C family serine protease [Streptomyces sp. CB02058]|uniref:S1C family serine protease n=1 Tax=Streptomyces sp. CB02058 TaxID=1703921 RepID=UPI0009396A3C|nr:trypsin-like peptidase domain-containing protein [Streptomyces sp. CB02058]OKI98048.1 protease [Streptomyces sp. CB02058]
MDDGKPSGPKTKWWSRPSTGRSGQAGPEGAATAADPGQEAAGRTGTDAATAPGSAGEDYTPAPPAAAAPDAGPEDYRPAPPATDRTATAPPATEPEDYTPGPPAAAEPEARPVPRAQPLHAPDAYSTPPYGGPGPWAPAPPVQRPVATPAHGTPVPPPYEGTNGHGTPVPPPYAGTEGHGAPVPPPYEGTNGHGAPVPPPYAGTNGHGAPVPPPLPHQQQHTAPRPAQSPEHGQQPQPGPESQQPSQWLRYDPWGAPQQGPQAQQPLSHPGPVQGAEDRPRRSRRGSVLVGAALLALVAGGIGGGIGAYVERNGGLTSVELPQAGLDSGGRAPDSVAGIAASALPSVVTLHVSGSAESGTGTGFVLDDKGHILTNNHVVAPAGSSGDITVTFSGGESASAEIVGKDSGYDLAVVKVTGVSGLKPLPLGNSDNVRVGDPVVAIGAPFDLSNTVTSGIISAKQRPITAGGEKGDGTDVSYVDALQTDAPINPGNSGGPLVDSKARVIGINSAIRAADSASGLDGGQSGSIGLGFAIPINQGKRVAEELINTGKATHPVIGVTLDMEFTGDGAKVGGKATDGGSAVTEGGPAAKAGIRSGDVITEVEGQRVHSGEELIVKIRAHRPGDQLDLRLTRGGKDLSMTLTLGSASGT